MTLKIFLTRALQVVTFTFEWAIFGLMGLVYVVTLSPLLPTSKFFATYVIPTGSMEPTVQTGSIIVAQPQDTSTLREGDVIVFYHPDTRQEMILHRIIGIRQDGPVVEFTTKGDNNHAPDNWVVDQSLVRGKMMVAIPYVGGPVSYIQTKEGFILMVGIPAVFLILLQLWKIKEGIEEEVEKNERLRTKVEVELTDRSHALITLMVILFSAAVSSMMVVKVAHAVFSDTVKLSNVGFSAANFLPTPSPSVMPSPTITPSPSVSPSPSATPETTSTPEPTPSPTVLPSPSLTPTPTPIPTGTLVINEVTQDAANPQEWVELYNGSSELMNLENWTISDGNSADTLPSISLAPNSFGVIVTKTISTTLKNQIIGLGATIIELGDSTIGSGFNTGGDRAILKNSSGVIVDQLSWGSDTSVLSLPVIPSGQSLARNPLGEDTDTAGDWELLTTPNPGTNPHSHIQVSFARLANNLSIEFANATGFTEITYTIRYAHLSEESEITEQITGQAIKRADVTPFTVPAIYMGTCSTEGSSCEPHEIQGNIQVEILYKNGQELIGTSQYLYQWEK